MLVAISNQGIRQDLIIAQGADFLTSWTFKNPDGSAMNLTGCLHAANLVKFPGGPVKASFILTVNANVVSGRLTAAAMAALTCGSTLYDEASHYYWDYKFTDATPTVWRPFYGDVTLFRSVTA